MIVSNKTTKIFKNQNKNKNWFCFHLQQHNRTARADQKWINNFPTASATHRAFEWDIKTNKERNKQNKPIQNKQITKQTKTNKT
jgi:hypothetical protein